MGAHHRGPKARGEDPRGQEALTIPSVPWDQALVLRRRPARIQFTGGSAGLDSHSRLSPDDSLTKTNETYQQFNRLFLADCRCLSIGSQARARNTWPKLRELFCSCRQQKLRQELCSL